MIAVPYIPEDVRFILCAPSFGAASLAPRPLPAANGLALVVGGGAAMAAQGSSSSSVDAAFTFKGFDVDLGAGAAMEPHKSSSSSFVAFTVFLGRKVAAEKGLNKHLLNILLQCLVKGNNVNKNAKTLRQQKHDKEILLLFN